MDWLFMPVAMPKPVEIPQVQFSDGLFMPVAMPKPVEIATFTVDAKCFRCAEVFFQPVGL